VAEGCTGAEEHPASSARVSKSNVRHMRRSLVNEFSCTISIHQKVFKQTPVSGCRERAIIFERVVELIYIMCII
jgi:hypothetical protein